MTGREGGRAQAIAWAVTVLLVLAAVPAGAQAREIMRFGIGIVYDEGADGTPVVATIIPAKPSFDVEIPRKDGEVRRGLVFYNLDIHGMLADTKKVQLGSPQCRATVTVSIANRVDGKDRFPELYYWIPRRGGGKATWVSHEDVVARRVADMEVSAIELDPDTGLFRFTVKRWPLDDRMMCHGN